MTKGKIYYLLTIFTSLLFIWGCSEEQDPLNKEVAGSGMIVYNNKEFNFSSTAIYKTSVDSNTHSTYRLIAADKPIEAGEPGNNSPLNALFIELSNEGSGSFNEGKYDFHSGRITRGAKGITYGMALLEGQSSQGIVGGSIDVRQEGRGYLVRFELLDENGKKLEGTLDFELLQESKDKNDKSARTSASCLTCSDNYLRWVSEVEARSWAARFAPFVKFDQAASAYPDDVEVIWNASTNQDCGQRLVLSDRSIIENRNVNFTTYFDVQISPHDSRRVFIDYWWGYARQPNCIGDIGGHDYDWEHVVIQFNRNTWDPSTITFFQHAGWYTQRLSLDRDDVYVGKVAHGSYHDSGGTGGCLYYSDYRNPGMTVDIAGRLYQLRCSNPALAADVDWGRVGKSPLWRSRDYWNYAPCKGNDPFGANGCARGDYKDTKLGNIERAF